MFFFLSQLKEKNVIRDWNFLCDAGFNLFIISFIQHFSETFHFVFRLTELGNVSTVMWTSC